MFERVREDIQSVFHRDPAARNALEVLTCYPGLHAVWLHRLAHGLWTSGWKWLARLVSNFGRWMTGIEIHPGPGSAGASSSTTAWASSSAKPPRSATTSPSTRASPWAVPPGTRAKRHPTLGNNVVVGAGAKVLGPFTVGEGAKVGSNAVVTKEVPPGATVVGIPGRIIMREDTEQQAKRQAMAEKLGFDAYGVSQDMPDPVARAIGQLLDHLQAVDGRLEGMCQALTALGSDYCAKDLPVLREEDFAGVKDEDGNPAA